MTKKAYYRPFGAACAATLRVCTPWFWKNHILIADSWFGSLRTAKALLMKGVHSIMNVKTGSKGFPKRRLKAAVTQRDQHKHMKLETEIVGQPHTIYASNHMDKQPLVLVHTCATSLPGDSRLRIWRPSRRTGACVPRTYLLEQPRCHAEYRNNYSAVDICNKVALGPSSV